MLMMNLVIAGLLKFIGIKSQALEKLNLRSKFSRMGVGI